MLPRSHVVEKVVSDVLSGPITLVFEPRTKGLIDKNNLMVLSQLLEKLA